ncbi:hypothetical protein CORT_0A11020 [Candida orthopsilosis Co 90-125]|uniref:LCCL domain-containing protein n=1 Tax=Candida orthopsilosis (strain 90-125) TaxID=1136231 RepID=H8WXI1_CANO9|nr:hypothetical protein CORT_0A11020 [Candida orthopsilosis Co 90-125]CCG21487.1 hypothetical protein CORT_0A11020 [Candida orthopsilosis Co 90-125]
MNNKRSIKFDNQDHHLQQSQSQGQNNNTSDSSDLPQQDPQDIPLTDLNPSRMSESELLTEDYENESGDEYVRLYHQDRKTRLLYKVKQFFQRLWIGPAEPRDDYAPRMLKLEFLEELPVRFNQNIPLTYRRILLTVYLLFWFGLCYSILIPYLTVPPFTSDESTPHIHSLTCSSSREFWSGKNAACGLNGELCPEIVKHSGDNDVVIRCPALCDRGSWTYSLIPIGDQRIKHRGYFIGGGDKVATKIDDSQLTNPYRADSYPCGAAVHAGLVSPFWGGCARLSYSSKSQSYFESTKGHYGVDDSIGFKSFFKSSFYFKILRLDKETFHQCHDPRIVILIINVVLGLPIVYLASGAAVYWIINVVGFWTICLATDPPIVVDASDPQDFASLISIGLERFLPTCSILYILWHSSTKRTLSEPSSPDEKISYLSRVILWYPLFWLGVLNNVSFDRLPVDRLTISDLKEQSGALLAVSSIIITISICAVIQAYKIWLSGRFRKYLMVYSIFVFGLILLAQLPGLSLRVHHYILAMLLIPGCATRGRTALMFQGILLGLFLSGASRWGLAAIAETITSLKRDDPLGKIAPPIFTAYDSSSGTLQWQLIPNDVANVAAYNKYSSVSLLINDIEYFVLDNTSSLDLKSLLKNATTPIYNLVEDALHNGIKDDNGDIPLYIRIGRKIPNTMVYSDFSNAAVLKWPSGNLTLPLPGLT